MTLQIGGHIIFVDSNRKEHDALITAIHGDPQYKPAINLVYVAAENGSDCYGAQKKNETSITHWNDNSAHGNCWKELTQ